MRMPAFLTVIFLMSACFWSDDTPKIIHILGETMGTTYRVTIVDAPEQLTQQALTDGINATLETVNAQMSNWVSNSEVSQFNTNRSTSPVKSSEAFLSVIAAAEDIHIKSSGVFDVTITPLINLWGFGPKTPDEPMPSQANIQQALAQIGHSRLLHRNDSQKTLQKSHPDVSINLSAIAKGYGVDQVAGYLAATGITRYLVEIGGDLVTAGLNVEGKLWSIGIETPDALTQTVQTIIKISGQAMATSGDYRNFFEQDGVRYSHIINATTGWPIRHRTASVTVLAETAMAADGWATAMLSLGQTAGMELAEQHQIAVLFITKDEKKFIINTSSYFEALTNIGK